VKMTDLREKILSNIRTHGFHITFVKAGVVPRFAYTIGLSNKLDPELLIAGGSYFFEQELFKIIEALANKGFDGNRMETEYGVFQGKLVHESWKSLLMLGANDILDKKFDAIQIVPEDIGRLTMDIPDASIERSRDTSRSWRWLSDIWSFPIPKQSVAITNMDALRGSCITEASRWEVDEWHLFAGHGPSVTQDDVRIVPLTTLLAEDESLARIVKLKVGASIWRNTNESEWKRWAKK